MTKPHTGRILVVDDDPDVLMAAEFVLAPMFTSVVTLPSPAEIERKIAHAAVDAVLLDMNFLSTKRDGAEGIAALNRIHEIDPTLSVVLITAYGDVSLAVQALKSGGTDFVLKPWQNEKLVATVSSAVSLTIARRETASLQLRNDALTNTTKQSDFIGSSPAFAKVLELIHRAAPTQANVLILGETGTGKEVCAREIHRLCARKGQPFIAVDLGAVQENLFESELFGHKRGAFTGADRDRVGHIQAADGGTLFLDEIANLPLHLQRKLLTVIERREVLPLGATQPVAVDVRLLTATNRPLSDLSRDEVFRQDLLFRIKTVEVMLPPLRERREDIPLLLEHFLALYSRRNSVPRRRLAPRTLELLEQYRWPGNIRELRHAVERAVILASTERLEPEDFPFLLSSAAAAAGAHFDLNAIERATIERALRKYDGNVSSAADALGLTRPALYRRMAKYGL